MPSAHWPSLALCRLVGVYRNARAEHMHNVIGFEGRSPAEFRATARRDVAAYGLTDFVDDYTVKTVKRLEDGRFELDGRWTVDKVILASGVRDVEPPIPGAFKAVFSFYTLQIARAQL